MNVASIGECMIEVCEAADGWARLDVGGDTLNTAVYMARLGACVQYVTAVGNDAWSERMLTRWHDEQVGVRHVQRAPAHAPGLYMISVDHYGERHFDYWRDNAAATQLLRVADAPALLAEVVTFELIYLSGITLSLFVPDQRDHLLDALAQARARGAQIAFDINYRDKRWSSREEASSVLTDAVAMADIVFASHDELERLGLEFAPRYPGLHGRDGETVIKQSDLSILVLRGDSQQTMGGGPPVVAVDTTAAGDSFAAAYLVARHRGDSPAEAVAAGQRLAGEVVRHRGAIIDRAAMPTPA